MYNLIFVCLFEEMMVKYIMDSLVVVLYFKGKYYIDVGMGFGLLGIVLVIVLFEI